MYCPLVLLFLLGWASAGPSQLPAEEPRERSSRTATNSCTAATYRPNEGSDHAQKYTSLRVKRQTTVADVVPNVQGSAVVASPVVDVAGAAVVQGSVEPPPSTTVTGPSTTTAPPIPTVAPVAIAPVTDAPQPPSATTPTLSPTTMPGVIAPPTTVPPPVTSSTVTPNPALPTTTTRFNPPSMVPTTPAPTAFLPNFHNPWTPVVPGFHNQFVPQFPGVLPADNWFVPSMREPRCRGWRGGGWGGRRWWGGRWWTAPRPIIIG